MSNRFSISALNSLNSITTDDFIVVEEGSEAKKLDIKQLAQNKFGDSGNSNSIIDWSTYDKENLPEQNYIVHFDAGEGKASNEFKNVKGGQRVGILPTAKNGELEYSGWYTLSGGQGTMISSDTIISSNVTFYANY